MLKTCPDPVDVNDIQFKLHCSLKIFENREAESFQYNHSLISCASRYGLLFVGSNGANFKAIQVRTVENLTHKDKEITKYPRRNISLPSPPKHVCVNCDSTILAVVVQRDHCPIVIFYDVLSFYKSNVNVIREVRLSATPGTYVTEVNWNPTLPGIFTACKSDGTLGNYDLKDNTVEINELPATVQCTSFCWSPKGKQLAVGSRKGHITQFKPELKAVKVINAPTFAVPHSLISLCWISNYQFIGVYQPSEQDGQAKLIVINAPKTGETNYINYDDVCYSGSSRISQFYLIWLQHWNLLMISSSNSMELGLLGAVSETWTQWNVSDCARAELPLGPDKQETLPLGMALDISNTKPLPWGEGALPPCPYLLLLSHQGIIYFYDIVNLKEGIPSICCPPDAINDFSGMDQFVISEEAEIKGTAPQAKSTFSFIASQPTVQASHPTAISQAIPQSTQSTFMFSKQATSQPTVLSIPQPSAPPNTSIFSKPAENKPLFGSQVTITPVKPQPQSGSIFGGSVTLTPVNPPQKSTESAEKYSSIFASLKAPSIIPSPVDAKPILVTSKTEPQAVEPPKIITPEVSRFVSDTQKVVMPETPKLTVPESSKVDPKLVIDEKVKGETQALFAKMVKDECISIESELKAVLHQGKCININIGTNEEKVMMIKELQDFQEFIKEIVDVSLGDSAEVHSLKQNLILSWAWYEEALSRYNMSKDETMSRILKSQPLDSATEKRKSDIQKIIYYLDSQLSQASGALDEQWDKFQDYTKKSHQVKMPTMEAIFQSMVRQNAILKKQSYILKDINGRLKQRNVSINTPSLFVGLNMNKLEDDLKRLQLDPEDGHRIIYEQTVERQKKMSSTKMNKIRDVLKDRNISHVTANRPSLNYSRTISPAIKNKHIISILGAQMSPVPKPTVVKNLQFSESTPLKTQDIRPTTVPPNTPVQQDLSKTFTFKSLDKNIAPPTSTFQHLSKSASVLSNLNPTPISSAFVPTTQASKNFVLSQVTPTAVTQIGLKSSFSPAVTVPSAWSSIQLPQFGLDGTSPSKKAEPFTVSSTVSTSNFDTQVNITAKSAASSGFPSFGMTSTTQSSFSFGKTPGLATAPVALKPTITPTIVPGTSVSTLPTSQPFFSFGKSPTITTATTINTKIVTTSPNPQSLSPATASSQTTTANSPIQQITTIATVGVTKPILVASSKSTNFTFSTPQTSSVTNIAKPVAITTPTSTVSKTVSNAVVAIPRSTSTPNFGAVTTALAAMTTQTTSIFGSISSSSVTTSLFGAKPTVAPDISTSLLEPKTSVLVSTTGPATIESSTSLPSIKNTSDFTSTTKSIFTPGTTSLSTIPGSVTPCTSSFMFASTITPATGSIFTPASTTPKSIFGSTISSTTPSIFSSPTSSTLPINTTKATPVLVVNSSANTISSVFSPVSSPGVSIDSANFTTPTSINIAVASSATVSSTTKQTSIISSTATTTPAEVFANKPATTQAFEGAATPTQASIFGNISTTTPSIFGNTITTTQAPLFGSSAVTTQVSIFTTPTTNTYIFGGATSATTQGSIFGNAPITTSDSIFGSPVTSTQTTMFSKSTPTSNFPTSTSSQSSNFGIPTTSQPSIFGAPISTQSAAFSSPTTSTSIFGNTGATTQATAFGNTSTTSQSLFGASPASSGSVFSNTQNSGFGVTSTQSSIFGSPSPAVSSTSIFGVPNTTSAFGQSTNSIFGSTTFGSTPTTTTSFGQPVTFGSNPGSIFSTPTTSSSIFGSGGTTFGTPNTSSNAFGSGSPSAFSFAPAANNASNALGFGGLNVGGTPSTTSSIFGGSSTFGQTQQNPFNRPSTFETPASATGSIFGTSTGSIFGSNTQSNFGSSFGSSSGFGQQTTFGQNTFGQQSTFGSPQPGPFSGGSSGVVQTGFGSPGNFQKPGGFGAPPVFGGSPQPAFGGNPSFGGSPAFGGAPAFGSPSKVFGSSTPTASFGGTDANSGFGNLANQNTVGFGNLAQQTAPPTSAPFSGNSSFSSWR